MQETIAHLTESVPTVRRSYEGRVVEERAVDLVAAEYRHTTPPSVTLRRETARASARANRAARRSRRRAPDRACRDLRCRRAVRGSLGAVGRRARATRRTRPGEEHDRRAAHPAVQGGLLATLAVRASRRAGDRAPLLNARIGSRARGGGGGAHLIASCDRSALNAESPAMQGFSHALEWTRTITGRKAHKALNLARLPIPPRAQSARV